MYRTLIFHILVSDDILLRRLGRDFIQSSRNFGERRTGFTFFSEIWSH